jgi:hypothetical protein
MDWAGSSWANKRGMVAAYAALSFVIVGIVRVAVFVLLGY